MTRVLIVEDDDAMAVALRDGFTFEGFEVTLARDGAAALRMAGQSHPDLIILDVMLPKMSGVDVCRRLRTQGNDVPIIMLTAKGQEIDKVVGLKSGADDYVTKPFSFLELTARVGAILRRSGAGTPESGSYRFGEIEVDVSGRDVLRDGASLDLSPREFDLLDYLIRHRGRAIGRDRLLSAVWGYDGASASRTVDMHVLKLRKKIEDKPEAPRWIVTVHGHGYKFTG